MIYGHNGTIHRTTKINIEVDKNGKVVSAWYRCMPLPFDVTIAGEDRAKDMEEMYQRNPGLPILAIEFDSEKESVVLGE